MSNENLHDGHRKRVKEKFCQTAFSNMSPHETLELALFYAIPRKDTNEIAHRLINRFGSISSVFDASTEDLLSIEGVSENTALYIKMVLCLFREYAKDRHSHIKELKTSDDCGLYLMSRYIGYSTELVSVISLDQKCKIIAFDKVCNGDLSSVNFSARRIVEVLLRRNASAAVLAHNHPSGIALPSKSDYDSTVGIIDMLKNVGITLLDHIIIADGDYVSLAESAQFKGLFSR